MTEEKKGRMSRLRDLAGLAGWIVLCFTAAAVGGAASAGAPGFYRELARPSWAPPAWLFGPVWTVLYGMMALSAWMVWRECGFGGASAALGFFLLQLGANSLWSWLFFSWRLGAVAFAGVLVLWILLAATMEYFRRIRPAAAAMLVPYLAWTTFAAVLTYSVWRLNPALLG
jgi:tryptophan-rich sensory protein